MADISDWRGVAVEAQARLFNSIPPEWRIGKDSLPTESRLDVTGFPAESGILSQHELEITESFATDIVARLATGEWSAQDVIIAFCKRAAIAHQLVSLNQAKCLFTTLS